MWRFLIGHLAEFLTGSFDEYNLKIGIWQTQKL
jgi:hypothetical protein